MAFEAAPGWGNLPNGNFSPTIFSKEVIGLLKNKAVVDEVTNTNFFGEIAAYGDSVRILKQPLVTSFTYTRGMALPTQNLVDDDVTLTVDQGAGYQFSIEDVEKKQAHVDWVSMAADSAAYSLLTTYEQNVFAAMETASTTTAGTGTAGATVSVGYTGADFSPYNLLNRLARLLDEAKVPAEGRFVVAAPRFFEELRKDDNKLIEAQVLAESTSMARDPRVAMKPLAGFKLFVSNNAPTDSSSNPTVLAGHTAATATAKQLVQSEQIRAQDGFYDIHRGLMIYGRKVIRPEMLYSAHISYV